MTLGFSIFILLLSHQACATEWLVLCFRVCFLCLSVSDSVRCKFWRCIYMCVFVLFSLIAPMWLSVRLLLSASFLYFCVLTLCVCLSNFVFSCFFCLSLTVFVFFVSIFVSCVSDSVFLCVWLCVNVFVFVSLSHSACVTERLFAGLSVCVVFAGLYVWFCARLWVLLVCFCLSPTVPVWLSVCLHFFCVYLCVFVSGSGFLCVWLYVFMCVLLSLSHRACVSDHLFACLRVCLCVFVCLTGCLRV